MIVIGIVVSRADPASEHVGEHLLDLEDWERHEDESLSDGDGGGTVYRTEGFELREFDEFHLYLEDVAEVFDDPSMILFASRHSGETGPLLTAHVPGNFGPAEFGGRDRTVPAAAPNALCRLVEAFDEHVPEGYDVGMECTHHGPSRVGVPSLFVEVGSAEEQWEDPAGARAVAESILDLRGVEARTDRAFVGFGGSHYVPRFERIVRETPWSVGHVAADWAIEDMGDPEDDANREVIGQAFGRTGTTYAVIDGEYPEIERVVEELGYRVVTETWIRSVGDRPLGLVERLEDALSTIDDGLRMGEVVAETFEVVDLPDELLAEAQGIDADATRGVIEENAIAFETEHGGTRTVGRAAVVEGDARDAIVEGLARVLEADYDHVEVGTDAVVVEETAFDPTLAREHGVPEGPKFGQLSAGQSVEIDGQTVAPEDVHVERTRRFPTS
ncbi:MAG TPA: D-aminoacyl-tRNA deacylase [Natrialbaceae archaeon]|nr:D-aminoacyl-tRNA deacylase [Natrialbaceae archaeon]